MEVVVPDGVKAEVILPDHPDDLVEAVAAGTHSWRYAPEIPPDDFPNMHTPLKVLQKLPVWTDVLEVCHKHVPQLVALQERIELSELADTLQSLVDASFAKGPVLEPDLIAVLHAASGKRT